MDPAWIVALVSLSTLVSGCLVWVIRWGWRVAVRITRFLDDYFGEPARAGVPATPGVMARLQNLEQSLNHVRDEMKPNGGNSMRDAINQVSSRIEQLEKQRAGREEK